MAGRTARRGFGARAVVMVALLGLLAVPLTGNALDVPNLVNSNFHAGWVANTVLVADDPGGRAFDPFDPPYKWADGRIEFLLTRWTKAVCDGSVPGDVLPSFVVADADGNAVVGATSIEDHRSNVGITQPDRLVRFTVTDPAYPHGLAAGRAVAPIGGGAPYTATVTVNHRNPNGTCNGTQQIYTRQFGIDRELPADPTITSPARFARAFDRGAGDSLDGTNKCKTLGPALNSLFGLIFEQDPGTPEETGICVDPITVALPQDGSVLVEGTATDPRTKPDSEEGNDYGFLETSGIKAVVVRLYAAESFGACGSSGIGPCPGAFVSSYEQLNPNCNEDYVITGTTITRCTESFDYSVDITADLIPGDTYAVDVYAIDLAGYRSAVAGDEPNNSDNLQGPESKSVSFTYLG